MKNKTYYYDVGNDVNNVECDLYDATLELKAYDGAKLRVEHDEYDNIDVGSGESGIYIKQRKRPLLSFKKQTITIYLPEHIVPDVSIYGKKPCVTVSGGIYGSFIMSAEGGKLLLSDCALNNAEVQGGDVDVLTHGATVRGNLLLQVERGGILVENTFASRSECRVKKGSLGLVNFTCKDCVLEANDGNISAVIDDDESNYSVNIVAKNGTANRESFENEGAANTLRAYSEKGGILVEFTRSEKESPAEEKEND